MLSRTRLLPLFILLPPLFTRTGSKKRELSWRDRQKTFCYSELPALLLSAVLFVGSSAGLAWAEDERFKACRTAAGFDEKDVFDITQPISQPREAIRLCQAAIREGLGTEKDVSEAMVWYQKAAMKGHADALQALKDLASDGYAQAYISVGKVYRYAPHLKDEAVALSWYKKGVAAERSGTLKHTGDGIEQLYLGWMHWSLGAHEQAVYWFRKAAEQGQTDAQIQLANMLEQGQGVRQDWSQAEKWYRQAAKRGNEQAYPALEKFYQAHPDMLRMRQDSGRGAPPGAFCACDEMDAFPGNAKRFKPIEMSLIKEAFETIDPRRPIDRTEVRYKQLNAIGQIATEEGQGTGVLIPGNYVLTNAHVAMTHGDYVDFNIGQTHGDSRWADSITGRVVAKGSYAGSIPEDWSLISLDESRVDANKKYGSISPRPLKDINNLREASETGLLMTAGFPGFKDPRWLWGESNVKVIFDKESPDTLKASSSSGMSGGAVLVEYLPGKFSLIGLLQSAGENRNRIEISFKSGFGFDSKLTKFVNFQDPVFANVFKKRFKEIQERE